MQTTITIKIGITMANKREFKKYIRAVGSALINDMMTAYYAFNKVEKDAIDKAIITILEACEEAVLRSNVKFDKTQTAYDTPRHYNTGKAAFYNEVYAKINADFSKSINEAIKEFNTAFPEDIKKELKENAVD